MDTLMTYLAGVATLALIINLMNGNTLGAIFASIALVSAILTKIN